MFGEEAGLDCVRLAQCFDDFDYRTQSLDFQNSQVVFFEWCFVIVVHLS